MENQTTEGADSALPQNNEAAVATTTATSLSIEDLAKRFSSEQVATSKSAKPEGATKASAPKTQETEPEARDTQADATEEAQPNETRDADEPEADKPAEDDEVLSQFRDKAREQIAKRFSSYAERLKSTTAERDAKAQEAQVLRQQLAQVQQEYAKVAQQAPVAEDPDNLAASINDEAGLTKLERDATETIRFFDRHRRVIDRAADREETQVEIDGKAYSIDALERSYDLAKRVKEEQVPSRRQSLQVKQQAIQQSASAAQQVLPKMFEQGSEEANIALQYIQANPKLRDLEDSPRLLAFAIKGLQAWQKEQKAAKPADATAAAKKATPKAPNLGEGGSAPVRSSRDSDAPVAKKQAAEALNRLKSSGSTSDLANFFKASR